MSDDLIAKKRNDKNAGLTIFRVAIFGVLIAIALTAIWRFSIYRSNVDIAIAELQNAYREQRPTESRIAGFEHSPFSVTRGETKQDESAARDRAERLLMIAAGEDNDPTSLAALGKYYLTQGNYEKANSLFELAEKSGSKRAEIHIDHGASLLELARNARVRGNRAKTVTLLDQSLGQFETALKLSPRSPEALFNRALCLESLYLKEQAKEAWKQYLAVDTSSNWAAESRNNLARIEAADSGDITPETLLERFVAAANIRDNAAATELISNTRELIAQKYLPQSLAMAITDAAPESRANLQNALDYAGELEKANIDDPFAADIAAFYRGRNAEQLVRLRTAQIAIKEGYRLCLSLKYADASVEFLKAKSIFEAEGNDPERRIAEYFVGYSLMNSKRNDEGLEIFERVAGLANRDKYRWLEMTALYWVAGAKRNQRRLAEANLTNKQALAIAEEIDDKYAIQRNMLDLSTNLKFVQQSEQALELSIKVLEISSSAMWSTRQSQRNTYYCATLWSSVGLPNAARAIALESIALADRLGDKMFQTHSRSLAGTILSQAGDGVLAKQLFDESDEIARTIADENSRNRQIALTNLQFGEALEFTGDIENATEKYKAADALFRSDPLPFQHYMARRGYLRGLRKLGKTAEIDEQLPFFLNDIEKFRDQIITESEKSSFFDKGVTMYDMAVEREIEKGNVGDAFNFSEFSTSRTLVERLSSFQTKPSNVAVEQITPSKPMTIDAIRLAMPDNVQIVKYTVLENKLLIWIISRSKFTVIPVEIEMTQLREQVESYVRLVRRGFPGDAETVRMLGAQLFNVLIEPVSGELDADKSVCIVPNKFLFYVPFAALNDSTGHPFIAKYNLVYSPSATVFVLSSAIATKIASKKISFENESLLAVGNPKFNQANFEGLPDLPDAISEVQDIRRRYIKPKVFTDSGATKAGFVNSLSTSDVVHFAGHYVVVDREPSASYLLFAENSEDAEASVLTNSEIDKMPFPRTKLVVMAACRSGLDNYFDGEGIVGLTRTFLAVGVPVVVASQWSVDSAAAAELMKRFHAHRRNDAMNTSRALRAAQLDLATEPNGRFNSPYYWAPFAVFGGYSEY